MSFGVYLTNTGVLAALQSAFNSFDESAKNSLASIASEIEETRRWLHERKMHWQQEVDEAEQEASHAEAILSACEAGGYYDDEGDYVEPNCSSEALSVTDAHNRLADSKAKLDNVIRWQQRVDLGAQEFQYAALKFAQTVTSHSQERQRFLSIKMQQYDAAAAVSHRAQLITNSRPNCPNQSGSSIRVAQIDILGETDQRRLLQGAFLKLAGASSGPQLINTLVELGTQVVFAEPNELERRGCLGVFDRTTNRITLCHSLFFRPVEVLAAHLAHEATHALWYRPSSIDQEYHAFKAQAEVWAVVKNDIIDRQNDEIQTMVEWGEQAFRQELRSWDPYSQYPESA